MIPKASRIKRPSHLAYVRKHGCLICGLQADAHHLKFAQAKGVGQKVGDNFVVPLCRGHHDELHRIGDETIFWDSYGIDALSEALKLWQAGGGQGEIQDA